jgi:N-acetylglucosaminyldiphosphoundecaprenol N-acetyl-beta-D-mannosaminyltransferase
MSTAVSTRITVFDYPVDLLTVNQALQRALQALSENQSLQVVTLNPEMLMQGDQNPLLGQILKNAGLVLPDGAGLVWALRRQGHSQAARLPGIEFSEHLLAYAAQHGWRVAIIGASQPVLDAALTCLNQRFVGLNVVYSHNGFFEDEAAVVNACVAAQPQLVLAALGVPRQEVFLANHLLPRLTGGVIGVGVGGSLDVWSGTKKRAPAAFRALNLEWLYRISSEPWRIQRVSKTLPAFVYRVLTQSP